MTSILIRSVIALSIGTIAMPVLAQTEQRAQGQSTECPAGAECPQGGGQQGQQPDAQGGAEQQQQPTEQEQTGGAETGGDQKQPATQNESPDQQKTDRRQTTTGQEQQPSDSSGTQGGADQPSTQGEAKPEKPEASEAGQASGSSETNVTVEQKTEITQVIREEKVDPIDVDFDVSVGVVVPSATTVKLKPLPPRIIKIVPRYEGYLFFILADGRIVIVEPSSHKVVVVLA